MQLDNYLRDTKIFYYEVDIEDVKKLASEMFMQKLNSQDLESLGREVLGCYEDAKVPFYNL